MNSYIVNCLEPQPGSFTSTLRADARPHEHASSGWGGAPLCILRAHVPTSPDEIEPDLLKALWAYVNARGVAVVTIEEAHDGLRALLEVARLASRLATRDSARFGGDVWRAKKHAADLLTALGALPPMRSVIESSEASALRQWTGASGSPLDGTAR